MLGAHAAGGAVGAAEDDAGADLAAGHVQGLGRRIDDVVDGLHGEVERHELDDRLQPRHGGADAQAGKAVLGDRGIDDALVAKLLQQFAADLVGPLVLGDLLADQEDLVVPTHLLGHGVAQGVADGGLDHGRAGRDFGVFQREGGCPLPRFAGTPPGGGRLRRGLSPLRGDRSLRSRLRGGVDRSPALTRQPRDRRIDLHVLGALGHENFQHLALIDGLDLHGRLVGLDLGDDLAGLDRVTRLDVPFGQRALFHRGRQRGHQNVGHAEAST